MKELVCVEQRNAQTEFYFNCVFPTTLRASLPTDALKRLGNLVASMAKGKKRRFKWKAKAKADWGCFDFTVEGKIGKNSFISFDFEIYNNMFESVSQGFCVFDSYSKEGLLQFGSQLATLQETKKACLHECAQASDNPFTDEYKKH